MSADASLGAGLTLTNSAVASRYYSFDNNDVPSGSAANREVYGPTNAAASTLTTATPGALAKQNPVVLTAAVGEPFTYRLTVPATPQATALHDVRILDDLSASAADLSFVSVTKVSGSQSWTPVNTGTVTNLVIEDPAGGIEIPAGEQIVLGITVVLNDTPKNISGLQFNNTASYTYDRIDNDPATRSPGGADTTGNMSITGPEALTLEKSGPLTMKAGNPATFTLNIHNPSAATAWNPTITDRLPHGPQGGMCAAPSNVTAQIFQADGVTAVSAPLAPGTGFAVNFAGDPTCEWSIDLLSPAGGLAPDQRLLVRYDAELEPGTANGIALTNIAGVTRWLSADPAKSPAGAPHIYIRDLTDGTPGTLDHQDAHTVTTEAPILVFRKTVQNVTTGQNPGSGASPGDTLRYTIQVTSTGTVGLPSFSIVDELDRLNATGMFAPGSLKLVSVPAGADITGTSGTGGAEGTGLVKVGNLGIGAQGEANDTLVVEFEAKLAPVITSGTKVLNQAQIISTNPNPIYSDDPNVNGPDDPNVLGDEDPTATLITSAPTFQVWKTSTVLGASPVLMAGGTLRYTLTIRNIGTEDAVNVRLRDNIPANTSYVANSTTLNGSAVPDPSPGVSPLQTGMAVNAPEDARTGYLRADAAPGATNVATVTFDVVVDPGVMNGLIIENQGFVAGSGAGSGAQPAQPSDDPATPTLLDPTRNVVGNLPLLGAQKTVQIQQDLGSPGIVDPGDVLRYTIRVDNSGAIPATGVVLTDPVPANTTYVADSLRLNGAAVGADGGVSPLTAGLALHSDGSRRHPGGRQRPGHLRCQGQRRRAGGHRHQQPGERCLHRAAAGTDRRRWPAGQRLPADGRRGRRRPAARHKQGSAGRRRRFRRGRRPAGVRAPGDQRRQPAGHAGRRDR